MSAAALTDVEGLGEVVIIGAGVGGLAAAAALAKAGVDVTVLEAHVYAGGCAGTFYHQGYRFDAGATLAGGFYPGGPMDLLATAAGVANWGATPVDATLQVHLPDGRIVTRWADERRYEEHRHHFGAAGERFFAWQERRADLFWELALRLPAWPAQSMGDLLSLVQTGGGWLASAFPATLDPSLLADALRPVSSRLRGASDALRLFVDGQLLIAAQATSETTNALYGASALDLPRRGVVHLQGGLGAIAAQLVEAVRNHGGRVLMRHEATRIRMERGRPVAVETRRQGAIPAQTVIANLTPWNLARLMGDSQPRSLRGLPRTQPGGGAFMLHLGVESGAVSSRESLHHQVLVREPLREGNSLFISVSPEWDASRAPSGHRAVTISTHTDLDSWWRLFGSDREAYEARKSQYAEHLLDGAERTYPGLCEAARLVLPGTPVTFQRFTRRLDGWVGGFPQTSLFSGMGPRVAPGLWMVGDSVFPGQSVAAVALGGLRVAQAMLGRDGVGRLRADTVRLPDRSEKSGIATGIPIPES